MKAVAILSCLFLNGCFTMTMGRKFDAETVKAFQVGKTSKAEVLSALGPPFTKTLDPQGQELWMYSYSTSTAVVHPASFIVPFYSRVDSQVESVTMNLTFSGDVLSGIGNQAYTNGVPVPAKALPATAAAAPSPAPAAVAPAAPKPYPRRSWEQ